MEEAKNAYNVKSQTELRPPVEIMMQESQKLFIHQRAKNFILGGVTKKLYGEKKTRQLGNLTAAWLDAQFNEKLNVKLKW